MEIDGSCHCGRIAFRAKIDPGRVFVCHCSDCQAISGSPFRWAVPVDAGDFELLRGTPRTYAKTGDSGRTSLQIFCPVCASPIYSETEGAEPAIYRLRLGTVRQRGDLVPQVQVWTRSAQGWACDLPGSECLERQ